MAQGTEERRIKVRNARDIVIKDRRAVWDGTVSLAKHAIVLSATDRNG
jgi:hypothetical protein